MGTYRTRPLGGGRWARGVLVIGLLAAVLSACTLPSSTASSSSSAIPTSASALPAPPAGASIVVTVPNLNGPPANSAVNSPTAASSAVVSPGAASPAAAATVSRIAAPPAATSAPVVGASTPSAPATATSATPTAAVTTPAPPATAVSTMNVKLANCSGCTVLATHSAVTLTLGAALVATSQGHAALLAIRGDGSVAGAANITYGTTFPTPPGGELGCDANGRCIVIAAQSDGTAVVGAYQVSAAGTWSDVTAAGGITSVTPKARTLTTGSGIGVAVQDQADGSTVWIVYEWDGTEFAVKGCSAAANPDPNALAMNDCLS